MLSAALEIGRRQGQAAPEAPKAGQVRSFQITSLDAAAKRIELELAVNRYVLRFAVVHITKLNRKSGAARLAQKTGVQLEETALIRAAQDGDTPRLSNSSALTTKVCSGSR